MYVCLCNGYRDAEIREVADSMHTPGDAPARPVNDDSPAAGVLMAAE